MVARRQAVEAGLGDSDLRRLLRRRELVPALPGVYVDHTGPLTWSQRAWAGVLFAGPDRAGARPTDRAALCAQSALRAWEGVESRHRCDAGPIHVAVDRDRRARAPAQVVVHRLAGLEEKAQWNVGPPRLRLEEAVVDVAATARDELSTVGTLTAAINSRRTTPDRVAAALADRTRIARRAFLASVLDDLEQGTCSVLEHGYLHRVERAHALPPGRRQAAAHARGRIYRDVLYEQFAQVVELDGRLDHARAEARDRDLERDLETALDGLSTVRLGWGQVFVRPCLTAARVGALLQRAGWTGRPRRCPQCP